MTSFNYYSNIPNAPDNPSYDQPLMQVNSQSINSIVAVDHVTFKTTGPAGSTPGASGGQHLQVTFNGKNVPGGTPTDPLSIAYTNSGTASTVSQMFYQNQNGTFQVSPIKAWGYVDGLAGGIIASQSLNVASAVRTSAGKYTITLTTNAVNSSNFAIVLSSTLTNSPSAYTFSGYTITGVGTFNITFNATNAPTGFFDVISFSFLVMQI